MAGQTNRKITLTIDAETNGSESVRDLAAEIDKLGKKGGDAAPEFERLSKELNTLAQQQDAVAAFQAISTAVAESKVALTAAKAATDAENTALKDLKATLAVATAAEEEQAIKVRAANAQRIQANQTYREAKAAVDAFVAGIGGAKRVTDENREAYNALTQSVRNAKAEYSAATAAVGKLTPEYATLKNATADVAENVRKQDAALTKANATTTAAQGAYEGYSATMGDVAGVMQRLGLDTQNLTGEQNKLAQSMNRLQSEADQLKAALAAPGQVALTTAQKIEQAFSGMGVKSVRNLKTEIETLRAAMWKLANDPSLTLKELSGAMAAGKARVAELEAEMNKAAKASTNLGSEFGSAVKQFGPATLVFNGITAAIGAVVTAGTQIPKVTAQFQTMERTLRILTGSTEDARKEMAYISGVANRVGADIKSTGDAYIKLTAATKDTNLAGAQTRRIFEAVSGAMGTLGASSAETESAIMAVTQMVSKGVVSMEEMRQQLGERLPGAFQITSKELGITTSELTDLISSGKLAAADMLPALAAGLEKVYKTGEQNDTLTGKWNRFINAVKESSAAVGESGLIDALLKVAQVGAGAVGTLVEGFTFAGKAALSVGDAIRTWDVTKLNYASEEAQKLKDRLYNLFGGADKTKQSINDMALAAQAAGKDFFKMADGTEYATKAVLGGSAAFVKYTVESEKAQSTAERQATSTRKVAETTRAAGEASITAANALGDEIDKRQVATEVATANAAALDAQVAAERRVIDVMAAEALMRAEALRDGVAATDAHVKQLVELGEEIAKRKAATDGVEDQAAANKVLADSLSIQAKTLNDNSTELDSLRATHEDFVRVLGIVKAEVQAGNITQQQMTVVENEARKAKALYNDAIKDQIEKIGALKEVKLADISIEQANVRLAIEVQKGVLASARARGDEAGAVRAGNEMKRLEIQMAQLVAKAKQAEAEASRLLAIAKIEEIRASGPLTAAKEAEIRALEASVRVKEIEAKIAGVTAKSLDDLRIATIGAGDAAAGSTGGFDSMAGSMNNAADAAERLGAAQQGLGSSNGTVGQAGTAKSILDDKDVRGRVAPVDVEAMMYKRNPNATVEEVKAAAKYYGELYARGSASKLTGNLLNGDNSTRMHKFVENDSMDKALELARQELATGQAIDLGTSVNDLVKKNIATANFKSAGTPFSGEQTLSRAIQSAGNLANQQTQSALTTVNINLNGKRNQLTMNQQSADNLAGIFRQIESDASRAS